MIRTRFAPSPTGYLHIGGVRTALFSWAFAKKHGGEFVLRIEDTDQARSTQASVDAILNGMAWVGLDYDEGPHYQTARFPRYLEVIQQLLESGAAYYDYTTKEELAALRDKATCTEEHFALSKMWRPAKGKTLPEIPKNVAPVVRFKMPEEGYTRWVDAVKGPIEIANRQLDDLIIARSDGTPTYNLCVVVDDFDMNISHVIRGDDHINNTPKQINILRALNAPIPTYAHLPMILNPTGSKMSKRTDAVSVTDYDAQGILPAALLNYLARLGWGFGNHETFSTAEFIAWFNLKDVSPGASRFDPEKLLWINAHHIKASNNNDLAQRIAPRLEALGVHNPLQNEQLPAMLELTKERASDLNQLAREVVYFYQKQTPTEDELSRHWRDDSAAILQRFALQLQTLTTWDQASIHALFKPFCATEGIKMGALGMPLRLAVCGTSHTPSVDAVLALIGKDETLSRLAQAVGSV